MKIVGGSFGLKGSAFLSGDTLAIQATKNADYHRDQVQSVDAQQVKEKSFGWLGAIVGALLLGALISLFAGPLGFLIGAAFAIAGSFYTNKRNVVSVAFADGSTVILECTPRAVDKLVRFKG